MKIKESLFAWLSHRYEVVVRDEENFEEKRTFSYSHTKALVLVVPILVLMFILGFWLAPRQSGKILQSSQELQMKKQLLSLTNTVDSLLEVTNQYERYYQNFRKAIEGDVKDLRADTSKILKNQVAQTDTIQDYISQADLNLRKEYESMNISLKETKMSKEETQLQGISFFPPIKGTITERFDAKNKHFGIDLVAKANEPIKAAADGTVILASWTEDTGNVIAIQHQGEIVSFYKHNAALFKKVGDFVKAGDVIAIIGNTGRLSSGPHLHFELWYKGNAINPEKFVSF
ncbi:M23 family metallopeptidase [Raineya orbicola]|uniref:Peptidase family M23 n=1 Tax=Raineya orbicola TaxID=2016530 RepID=A0A2N3IJZ5_9BACT|nr:M23 family metallopeptidase [Raineya orbicola]PKQ70634.1 Peptidase family M23 [Raineya orbicola]